jgi:hypothetical protein
VQTLNEKVLKLLNFQEAGSTTFTAPDNTGQGATNSKKGLQL